MTLNPRFAGQKLAAHGGPNVHTIELFLDYVCPYSKKMFDTVYLSVFPLIKQNALVHEAGAAVLKLAPEKFWPFSKALFDQSKEYYDVNVVNEVRNKTYERLAKLGGTVGLDEKKMYDLLKVSDRPGEDGGLNVGNGVTDDVKLMVKANRLTGVHVTPTVLFNGVVEGGISSSFSKEDWEQWLEKNVV
ncbi:hypothetical protein LTR62_004231 [Meristemomyces frigidus]|uniref:Thioredoxin-like fold domain-containing protein n=1 Tax=Meristemomyces frigidus TaxID=1508187 RepID=A0AAN7THS6_9PEZI|nr:hypothetical protein LTR62_004231 [Meristemomyces frigidus]